MDCCCRKDTDTVLVRLKFRRDELLYDIKNYAYVESDIMTDERQGSVISHAQHQLADIGEEGNVNRVSRILSLVHAEVIEMLYPYTKREPIEGELDNILVVPSEYTILMRVPKTMSRTTTRLLEKLIHEYMVYRVMSDWLSITNKDAAVGWRERAEETKAEIESVKNLRRKAFTRKISLF